LRKRSACLEVLIVVGHLGRDEREAGYEVMRFDMEREKGKACEVGENKRLIKFVADASDGAKLVHVYVGLMNAGTPSTSPRSWLPQNPQLQRSFRQASLFSV
jgi:hypothetical protein